MKRVYLLLILLFASFSFFGQVVYWPLTSDSLPVINDNRMIAGPFWHGSGTGNINFGTSGAYCNGWTTNPQIDTTDFFYFSISVDSSFSFLLDSIEISYRRSLSGIRRFAVYYSLNYDFSSPVFADSFIVTDDDDEHLVTLKNFSVSINYQDTLYFRLYGYLAESGSGTWRINDNGIKIYGQIDIENINDLTSYVTSSTQQPSNIILTPYNNNHTNAIDVFKFTIVDQGTSDNEPTYIKQIKISNAHPTNEAIWENTIEGIVLTSSNGPITITSLAITNDYIIAQIDSSTLNIPNNSSEEVTLSIYIKQTNITDNSKLQFKIDSINHSFIASPFGSGFSEVFPNNLTSNVATIQIEAEKLIFSNEPNVVWANQPFDISILSTDNFGNQDLDFSEQVLLTLFQGNGTLTPSSPTTTLNNGYGTFSNISYNGTGSFYLKAEDVSQTITPAISSSITSAITYDSIYDTFSDGDLTNTYLWLGDINAFSITTDTLKELVLYTYTSSADTSYISIPFHSNYDSLEWSLKIRMDLSPSSNNYVRYILISPQSNLKTIASDSYFLQLGETGTNDAITLIKTDSTGNQITLCRSTDGDIAEEPNVRIKVIYNLNEYVWKIYADYTGSQNYEQVAQAQDTLYIANTNFFSGINVRYSSTNDENKFFFDDFYLGRTRIDTIPPHITSVEIIDSVTLSIHFSEGVKGNETNDIYNYFISNGIGNPALAYRDSNDYSIIHILLPFAFTSEQNYTLTVNMIKDFAGNIANNLQYDFLHYLPELNDITINEIMADPSPQVELPEYEYVELYNTSEYKISLNGWTLQIGTRSYDFPANTTIDSNKYIIVSTSEGCYYLSQYGNCLDIITSSTALTNSEQTVTIFDKFGRTISSVSYSDDWYENKVKAEGGWSLEKIDPSNPCQGAGNWTASVDKKGGTPGNINSVFGHNPDNSKPYVYGIGTPAPDTVIVYFSESMDSATIKNTQNYIINYGIETPSLIIVNKPYYNEAALVLSQPLSQGVNYTLTFTGNQKDCSGNTLETNSITFSLPIQALKGDVVINEILYNPEEGCAEYIEIYNASNHSIDLKNLRLANKDELDTSGYDDITIISNKSFLMMPGTFWVATENPEAVKSCYYAKNPANFIKTKSFPSLPADNGNVALINKWLETIDYFEYNDNMQFYLLTSTKGVALERINYYLPTNDPNNWHSAAQTCGFGTPTYQNSQFIENPLDNNSEIWLSSEIFSPDNDGYQDILQIHYKFSSPNYTCTIIIFDATGRPVKTIAKKELVGTEGAFSWDGTNDYNLKTQAGVYIVYVETVNNDGKTKVYKMNVIVGYKH